MTPEDVIKAAKILNRIETEARCLAFAECAADSFRLIDDIGYGGPIDPPSERFHAAVKAAAVAFWRERLALSQSEVLLHHIEITDEDMERGIKAAIDKERLRKAQPNNLFANGVNKPNLNS
jgi:hypothetical protein